MLARRTEPDARLSLRPRPLADRVRRETVALIPEPPDPKAHAAAINYFGRGRGARDEHDHRPPGLHAKTQRRFIHLSIPFQILAHHRATGIAASAHSRQQFFIARAHANEVIENQQLWLNARC